MTPDGVITKGKVSFDEAVDIAKKGTHCGMCKIDFLESGLCPAGQKHGFIAYWPEGRMEILKALAEDRLKPTEKLFEIANSCSLCGFCDRQCNFAMHLRPEKVAGALKDYVDNMDRSQIQTVSDDDIVRGLREIVGEEWATNDPVILTAYRRSIIIEEADLDFYVVMPENTEQVSKIIKFANKNNIPYMARGGGTLLSFAIAPTILSKAIGLEKGIIIDLLRLKKFEVDIESQTATVGAGITAYELQKEVYKHGFRVNLAEAGAHVCSNIASTGICTTWSNYYGQSTDNYIDLEFVDDEGNVFRYSDKDVPNPYAAEHGFTSLSLTPPGIITEAIMKLHNRFEDEESFLVPFENLKDALDLALKLAKETVGYSLAVLGRKYVAEFICPTPQVAKDFEYILTNYMRMNYAVDIICNKRDKEYIEGMVDCIIDQPMMKKLILGSPKLVSLKDSEFLKILSEEENPLKALFAGPMKKHLEEGLDASPEQISKVYDEDLQEFFRTIYSKPEMTDLVWLHSFRIFPSRLMRQRQFIPRGGIIWTAYNNIVDFVKMLQDLGVKYNLENGLGYIAFWDKGTWAQLEFDYFYDHNDPDAIKRTNKAILESLEKTLHFNGIFSDLHFYFKGLFRKEHVLYPIPKAINEEEQILFKELIESILGE
jgi:hypothetical protein